MSLDLPESLFGGWWRYLVSVIGMLLFTVGVGSVFLDGRLTGEESLQISALAVLSVPLIALGARVAMDIDEGADAVRVLAWMSGGVLVLAPLGAWFQVAVPTADTDFEVALLFLSAIAAGAFFGSVVGYYDVRVRRLVERASREEARREFLDEQQDALSALNSILRHQILNDLNAISGHAELIRDDRIDPDAAAETIEDHCGHVDNIVSRIETVVDALTLVTETREISVDEAVERAIQTLQDEHPSASIGVEGDTGATVLADDLLYLALYEVLDNAVVHGEPPVTVTVDAGAEEVTVAVDDDGPGVDVSPRDALFEPNTRGSASDGDGLGLFLATLILDRYDGDIQLTGTATFELWVATDGSEV